MILVRAVSGTVTGDHSVGGRVLRFPLLSCPALSPCTLSGFLFHSLAPVLSCPLKPASSCEAKPSLRTLLHFSALSSDAIFFTPCVLQGPIMTSISFFVLVLTQQNKTEKKKKNTHSDPVGLIVSRAPDLPVLMLRLLPAPFDPLVFLGLSQW